MDTFITKNAEQTRKLGELLAKELRGGGIICLTGDLGSGKTTFAQGILKGLGAKGPHTSPTFVVMKHYKYFSKVRPFPSSGKAVGIPQGQTLKNIYHIDCYRVGAQDILGLGWEEIVSGKNNVVIVEWAERIKSIIPEGAVWVEFEHSGDDKRKLVLKSQYPISNFQ